MKNETPNCCDGCDRRIQSINTACEAHAGKTISGIHLNDDKGEHLIIAFADGSQLAFQANVTDKSPWFQLKDAQTSIARQSPDCWNKIHQSCPHEWYEVVVSELIDGNLRKVDARYICDCDCHKTQ